MKLGGVNCHCQLKIKKFECVLVADWFFPENELKILRPNRKWIKSVAVN